MAYAEPRGRGVTLPVVLAGGGAAVLLATIAAGGKAPLAGGAVFLVAVALALADSAKPVFTWPNAISALALLIWFVPIKLYTLPVQLPFNLEPYRLFLLALVFAWIGQGLTQGARIDAGGRGKAVVLMGGVAIVSTIVNFGTLRTGSDSVINPLFYFLTFLLLFVFLVSTLERRSDVDKVLRVLVAGAAVVALFAIYEARTRYNIFNNLSEFVPILEKQQREVLELRGGRLRVQASSQHPIALGVALIAVIPVAIYVARIAATAARRRLWGAAAVVCATAAVTTVSRTTVLMVVAMGIAALLLRGGSIVRYWPVLLVLPVAVHFVAPGALGGLYKSFFPKEGLLSDVNSRAGESGSGRFADIGPGVGLWKESPVVGHGPGGTVAFERKETHLGPAPIPTVIFDNQYMSTLVYHGLLGLIGLIMLTWGSAIALFRAVRRSTGPPSDLLVACAVSSFGFVVAMFFYDALSFAQSTIVFIFIAALGLRVARLERERILVESPTSVV